MKGTYDNCERGVRVLGENQNWLTVQTGVRHGGLLSPLLFRFFMEIC